MGNPEQAPGDDKAPIESRRTTLPEPDPPAPAAPDVGEDAAPDLPSLGEFSPESARPSPLDDIAEVEREQMPRD